MSKLRVALVGLGRMGKNHLRVLSETPDLELVAVVDVVAPDGAAGNVPLVRSIEALDAYAYDAAVVATPTATHADVAGALIERGKALLVEKPIASTYTQARALLEAAAKKNVKVAVGHVERFNPAVRKLREVIASGWLGVPVHYSFTRVGGYPDRPDRGNNVLLDLAVHDIDVLRALAGPLKVESSLCHSTWKKDIYDTAEIFLASASGPSASIHVNWVTPTKIRSIRVTGTRGVVFVDYILQTCELAGGRLLQPLDAQDVSFDAILEHYRTMDRVQFGVRKEEPLKVQAQQWRDWVRGGPSASSGELCLGADALAAVLIAERAVADGSRRAMEAAAEAKPAPGALPAATDAWI